MTRASFLRLVAGSFALLATGVWLGGLLVLGAIVAPTVFREVPAPSSADAMTMVFTRFDKIAMMAAAIIAVAEVVRIRASVTKASDRVGRIDVARLGVIGASGTLAVLQGTWLSPTIVALHHEGAIRGLGPLGERLERFHAWSEMCGKTECLLLVVLVVLIAHGLAASPSFK